MTDDDVTHGGRPITVERRGRAEFRLTSGRIVRVDIPVPITAAEALELLGMLPGGFATMNASEQNAAGHVAMPDGTVRAIPRES